MAGNSQSGNPFSTRYTRPGALAFRFYRSSGASGVDSQYELGELVDRLQTTHRHSQIVGPHGSGKSTLVAALIDQLEKNGLKVSHFQLHDGQRSIPSYRIHRMSWDSTTHVIVDGFEQLSWFWRWRIRRSCRRRRAGLLITAHADSGLPTLWRTVTSVELLADIARELVVGHASATNLKLSREQIGAAYRANDGNLREALFQLYDEVR